MPLCWRARTLTVRRARRTPLAQGSIELHALSALHLMEHAVAGARSNEAAVIALLDSHTPGADTSNAGGLDVDGYALNGCALNGYALNGCALNGSVDFEVIRSSGPAQLQPTAALPAARPFNAPRP
eukprot:2174053-Rhodomonas_salina.4